MTPKDHFVYLMLWRALLLAVVLPLWFSAQAFASDEVVDLNGRNFEEQFSLGGPWQVIRDKVVRPLEYDSAYTGALVTFPDRWDRSNNRLAKQKNWPKGFGAASYRLLLEAPTNGEKLTLLMPAGYYSAAEIWINGNLAMAHGRVSETPEGAKSFYLQKRIPLPQTGAIEVVMIISNFEHAVGGIQRPPSIGWTQKIEQDALIADFSYFFVFSALSALLIFHLAYFVRSLSTGKNWSHFWYCVLVAIVMIRVGTLNTVFYRVFIDFPQISNKFIEYLTLFSGSAAYAAFLASIFPNEITRTVKRIVFLGTIPFVGSVLFLPVHLFTLLQDYHNVLAICVLLFNTGAIFVAWHRKREGAGAVALFTTIFLATAINDALYYAHAFNLRPSAYPELLPFGFLLLSIGHAIALSSRSIQIHEHSLTLANNLQQLNQTLDRRVKEQTQEANIAKEVAEKSSSEKTSFIAAASHDLRQPVHALSLFNRTFRDKASDPTLEAIANKQHLLIGSLSEMLETMLEASRLEAKTLTQKMKNVPLGPLFLKLRDTLQPVAIHNDVDFRVVPSSHVIYADKKYLRRVLSNLIINAINASTSGRVLLGVKSAGNNINIIVADNGSGIAPEDQKRIFEKFVQLKHKKKDGPSGLGLGLSIVAELCALMKMPLSLSSEVGQGSRFAISVPKIATPVALTQEPATSTTPPQMRPMVILVVEDNEQALEATVQMFRQWGHAVRGATSQDAALEALEDLGKPDLLVTDYRLDPRSTGLDVIAAIEEHYINVPAVIVTGATSPDDLKILNGSGFPVFHKPLNPDRFQKFLIAEFS